MRGNLRILRTVLWLQMWCAEQDIVNLVKLTVTTGNRLLFDVNLQLRFGNQWDPSNAIDLFEFFSSHDFCDIVDWELGNGWLFCPLLY